MARVTGSLENLEGRYDNNITIYKRNGKTFTRKAHIRQPRRLTPKKLLSQERQGHNNAVWRALKETGRVYMEGGENAPYNHFMSINTVAPVPFFKKSEYHNGRALLLPNTIISDGPLTPANYKLGDVDGKPALLTDLEPKDAKKSGFLLYILHQEVDTFYENNEKPTLRITLEDIYPDDFITIPSTLISEYISKNGTLALIGEKFADPMLGFALVRIQNGHASRQQVVTRCTYYERYTTEEAMQNAAESYGGFTQKDHYL